LPLPSTHTHTHTHTHITHKRITHSARPPPPHTHKHITPPPRPPADPVAKPYILGREARAGDKPQTLADLMPDWVGYGALYGISVIPVMLAVGAVLVLFYNSLR
jgi:hypothetical protein